MHSLLSTLIVYTEIKAVHFLAEQQERSEICIMLAPRMKSKTQIHSIAPLLSFQ